MLLHYTEAATHRKPPGLIYASDDRPPLPTCMGFGCATAWNRRVSGIADRGAGGGRCERIANGRHGSGDLLISGIGSILVASRVRHFGFGHLMPMAILSSFVVLSMLAARAGGLP